ncbi:MAG TPA: AI-2E family transporter [Alcanivorax sp.]|nr:AI-2E family transporter [Alcanivorax sp.]
MPPHTPSEPDQDTRKADFESVTVRSAMLTGIFLLLVMYTLYAAATLFMPLMVAFLTSLIFTPVVRALRVLKIPPPVSAAAVVLGVLGLGFGALYGLSEPALEWLEKAPRDLRQLEQEFHQFSEPMQQLKLANAQIEDITPGNESQQKQEAPAWSPVKWILSGTWSALYGITLSVILLYFMLASGDSFLRKLVRVIPHFEHKRAAVETVRQIQTSISLYLGTISIINVCLGAGSALILYLLDMPNPILFGVMVGMLNFAPYIGPIISGVVLFFVSSLNFEGLTQALLPPFLVMALNVLEGQFITPTVAGHRLALSPVVVFLSILLWGWMWGIVGILIAVPLLVCIKLVCDNITSLRPLSEFLGR